MPYVILLYVYRKPGSTPAEFKEYWETRHVPLIQSIAGPDFPLSHTRHYIQRSESGQDGGAGGPLNPQTPAAVLAGTQEDFDYDGFATLTFRDKASFQTFFAKVSAPDAAAKIAEDEERFADRSRFKIALLGEVTSTTNP